MFDLHVKRFNAHKARVRKLSTRHYPREMLQRRLERLAKSKELGSGAFGTAMTHPTDPTKVIKIGPIWDGWLIWAAYCQIKAGTSPHLLKVHSIRRYEKHGLYVAVIERLEQQIRDTPMQGEWRAAITAAFNCGVDPARGSEPGTWFCKVGEQYFNRVVTKYNWTSLWTMLADVKVFAEDNGLARDLHSGNAMLREDGTVVVTDPFSDGSARAREALAAMAA